MRKRPGNHAARRDAVRREPSPVTALRELLANALAADVTAVTPMVCDVLRDEITVTGTPARREMLRDALVQLARNAEPLGEAAGRLFRDRFDLHLNACELPPGSSGELVRALNQSAERLRQQTAGELQALSARVGELLGRAAGDGGDPIAPELFARTVLDALGAIGLAADRQAAAFRAFDPALLHIAPDLYAQANLLLFEHGAAPARADRNAVLERLLAGRERR